MNINNSSNNKSSVSSVSSVSSASSDELEMSELEMRRIRNECSVASILMMILIPVWSPKAVDRKFGWHFFLQVARPQTCMLDPDDIADVVPSTHF